MILSHMSLLYHVCHGLNGIIQFMAFPIELETHHLQYIHHLMPQLQYESKKTSLIEATIVLFFTHFYYRCLLQVKEAIYTKPEVSDHSELPAFTNYSDLACEMVRFKYFQQKDSSFRPTFFTFVSSNLLFVITQSDQLWFWVSVCA